MEWTLSERIAEIKARIDALRAQIEQAESQTIETPSLEPQPEPELKPEVKKSEAQALKEALLKRKT
jgi:hypothetical protein